ncbi:ankyrin [Imleria badia]|nr:ankyrin [Imleria badia]
MYPDLKSTSRGDLTLPTKAKVYRRLPFLRASTLVPCQTQLFTSASMLLYRRTTRGWLIWIYSGRRKKTVIISSLNFTHAYVDRSRHLPEQNFKEILGWLDGLNCAEKQDVTLSLRQPDTCKWLFNTTQYKMWRNGECSGLWLRGKPGAGKSVLASSVINSLEKVQREGGILAFFYCDFRNERSTSASEAFRSILSQLLHQFRESAVDPGSLIDDLVDAKKRGGATRNNTKELAGFASRTAKLFVDKPLVVVDALDECKDVETLLEGLNALMGYAQLFTTSRPLPVIKDGLSGVPLVSMDDMGESLSADIALHVTRELDARRRLRVLGSAIKTEIHSVLCEKADGMFRWVQCSIDTLNRCVTLKELSTVLDNLPEGLDETYERILLAIDTKTREGRLALRALVWLVAALRPLHIDELMEGLSIDLEKWTLDFSTGPMHREALLDACGSLVTYNEKTSIIILSHFSVKEYLMSEFIHAKLPQYHINWERAHLQLARSCIFYISIFLKRSRGPDDSSKNYASSEHEIVTRPVSHPLLDYVLDDALNHFRHIGPRIGSILRDIKILADDIERNSWEWDNMCLGRVANSTTPRWPVSSHDLPLYILVAFAPDSLLRAYLPRSSLKPKKGTNPLVYAAYFNKHEQARTLLSRGAKLNCRGLETDGSLQVLPIEVALRNSHHSMVTFFVAEGSIVSPQLFMHLFSYYWSIPCSIKRMLLQTDDFAEAVGDLDMGLQFLNYFQGFLMTATHGQDLILTVRRMIQVVPERGQFSTPNFFGSFLHTAVEHFREDDALETVKLLVNHDCDPLQVKPNSFGKSPLYITIERAHISVVQYLISLGLQLPTDMLLVALKLWDSELTTAIGVKLPMVRFLVENGADVRVRTEAGDSVLHVALQSFYEHDALGITELLVGYGCNLIEANSSGKSSLHIAIEQAHISVARYLLSLGVPLPPDILVTLDPGGIWRTARMIHFLVDNGADVHACTETGDTLFHIALESFQPEDEALELAKLLVGYGCDPLAINFSGKIPLHIAIEQAHISVVQFLFSLGISLPPDLLFVALNSQESVIGTKMTMIHFLIHSGVDVHAHTETGDTAFHVVFESFLDDDALNIAELLISYGCDPLEANSSGKTPLHIAIEEAHTSVLQYLLSFGIPLPPDIFVTLNPHGRWMTVQMVCFLLENGADVNARNDVGDSVLHVVLESLTDLHEAREIVELLVLYGCDPLEANSSGKIPLRIAVERQLDFVEIYLRSFGACDEADVAVWYEPHNFFGHQSRMRPEDQQL